MFVYCPPKKRHGQWILNEHAAFCLESINIFSEIIFEKKLFYISIIIFLTKQPLKDYKI
jgi:hypothetical protein